MFRKYKISSMPCLCCPRFGGSVSCRPGTRYRMFYYVKKTATIYAYRQTYSPKFTTLAQFSCQAILLVQAIHVLCIGWLEFYVK